MDNKIFEVSANGTVFGAFEAEDERGAFEAYAVDAGYKSIAELAAALDESEEVTLGDLVAADVDETYDYILSDIASYAASGRDDHTLRTLNIRRGELIDAAMTLEEHGRHRDWSSDLDRALSGTAYIDTLDGHHALIDFRLQDEDEDEAA